MDFLTARLHNYKVFLETEDLYDNKKTNMITREDLKDTHQKQKDFSLKTLVLLWSQFDAK